MPRADQVTSAVAALSCVILTFIITTTGSAQGGRATDDDLKAATMKAISGIDYGADRPTVAVSGGVIMLSGTVSNLWLKMETINRAIKIPGMVSVQSDLIIPSAESDAKLVSEVTKQITGYSRFTVYDDFEGSVKNGVVHLSGAVTEELKLSDVIERIAKVHGVQDIDNKVTVLPANQSDNQLRAAIVRAIYRNPEFENYSMANPPIHVIVNNGYVTLTGIVRSDVERIKAHQSAASVFGILKLDDRIKLAREVK
jgi:hyperosmotically inducible protein